MKIGFFGLLTICLIVLKLAGVIAWPWIWVIAPIFTGIAIWLVIVTLCVIVAAMS